MPNWEGSNQIRLNEAVIEIGGNISLAKKRDELQPKKKYILDVQNLPTPATNLPIADNEADASTRTGIVGTSLRYAREDHNHPIRRQGNPAAISATLTGSISLTAGGSLAGTFIASDEEAVYYRFNMDLTVANVAGAKSITIPSIAGFQPPIFVTAGTYRLYTKTGFPPQPFMGHEINAGYAGTNIAYLSYNAAGGTGRVIVTLVIKYIRS